MVSSTKPDLVQRVGVIATCTSISSATSGSSRWPGVVPQSSCSLRPMAPALDLLRSASGQGWRCPAEQAEVHRQASAAWSIGAMCQGPGVQVVAKVPVAGRCRRRSWW